jgi:hypothetical protein
MTAAAPAVGRTYLLRSWGNGKPIEERESLGGGGGTCTDAPDGHDAQRGPGRDARSAPGADRAGLLTGHISSQDPHNPFDEGQVEWWAGASLVKVSKQGRHEIKPEEEDKRDKGKRGRIATFSRASRRRMMLFLAKVRLAEDSLPLFGTTTYPDMFPEDAAKFKRDLQAFLHRLKRRFPEAGILWRLEFKQRKSGENIGKLAPHFHWLLWNVPWKFPFKSERGKWCAIRLGADGAATMVLRSKEGDKICTGSIPLNGGADEITHWFTRNWYDVAGTGDIRHYRAGTNVKALPSAHLVFCYVSKYLSKVDREALCQYPGRFWGVVNPRNIPLGQRVVLPCTGRQAAQVIRFLRRFMRSVTGRKVRTNEWSANCICAADFWAARMPQLVEIKVPGVWHFTADTDSSNFHLLQAKFGHAP